MRRSSGRKPRPEDEKDQESKIRTKDGKEIEIGVIEDAKN